MSVMSLAFLPFFEYKKGRKVTQTESRGFLLLEFFLKKSLITLRLSDVHFFLAVLKAT